MTVDIFVDCYFAEVSLDDQLILGASRFDAKSNKQGGQHRNQQGI
ncbi:MAG: hypothetical protein ACYTFK_09775 [Planctomycetota bacterium]|jgi:hypothetical protein